MQKIKESILRIKSLRALTFMGMLTATYVLSSFFLQFFPTETIKISFGFLFLATAGFLLGPVPAFFVGGLGDFLAWVIKPAGPLNVGIMLCMALMGLWFGLCFYKEKISIVRSILAAAVECAVIELGLKTLCLGLMYGSLAATFVSRIIPSLVMAVLMAVLNFLLLKALTPFSKKA